MAFLHESASDIVTEITPSNSWNLIDFKELWRYRDLLWILGMRDLKIRYQQTIVGVAWAVIQPLTTMAIFAVLFGFLGKTPTDSTTPYYLVVFCALLPWQFVASSLAPAATSIVTHQNMVQKIYFPRIVLPLSAMISPLLDYLISLIVLAGMMWWCQTPIHLPILMVPVFMLMCILTTIGMSLWFAALSTTYRDFMYTIPFMIQIGFFLSSVIFETRAIVPEKYWIIIGLNPMVTVSEGMRWALLGAAPLPFTIWGPGVFMLSILLISGLAYFRRMEKYFADRV